MADSAHDKWWSARDREDSREFHADRRREYDAALVRFAAQPDGVDRPAVVRRRGRWITIETDEDRESAEAEDDSVREERDRHREV